MDLRVFLVEDSSSAREILEHLFRSVGGVRVMASAMSEKEANLWLERHPGEWQVAVVDLVLEQGSGFPVIRRARELAPNGGIVVVSGYVTPALQEHCVRLGADAVFDKTDTEAFARWLRAARDARARRDP